MDTQPRFPPDASTGADAPAVASMVPPEPAVVALGEAFAREPELIRALLEGWEAQPAECRKTILAATRVAMATCPTHADLLYRAAEAAMTAGDYSSADNALQQALSLNPDYKDALILAARVALARQDPQRAVLFLQTAVARGADYPDVQMLLGEAWSRLGDSERARWAYERACQLNPALREARAALAKLNGTPARGGGHELPA